MSETQLSTAQSNSNASRLHEVLGWCSTLPAVIFNTCFAILAIVTLCGIVFITKPQAVIHDIPPGLWAPLLIVIAPAQIYAQFLSWHTIFAGQIPTGHAIAMRQTPIKDLLKPLVAFFWLCNFGIGFAIVVSLAKPHPANGPPTLDEVIAVLAIGSLLAFAANVYLLLAIKTCTRDSELLRRVWRCRAWIAVTMGIAGAVYYGL